MHAAYARHGRSPLLTLRWDEGSASVLELPLVPTDT
jgi:hypothetical protein